MHDGKESKSALLLVDLMNPFDYEGSEGVLSATLEMLPVVRDLARRFRDEQRAVIYVNDNFGRWRSSFEDTVQYCAQRAGGKVAEALRPGPKDYFVLKPHRSGFYATPLDLLLTRLGTRHVVIAGITTDMCVLATASDAQIRGYATTVVRDATAALDPGRHERALLLIEQALSTKVVNADELDLDACENAANGQR
jgi:nicotinamidase-related amidase